MTTEFRPTDIVRMIGQDRARKQIVLDVQAALTRRGEGWSDAMPSHTLLVGPRGCGKTTLATIVAGLLGGRLVSTTASAVKNVSTLGHRLATLVDDDVLFIDEIHGLPRAAQELLYTAMEDGVISVADDGEAKQVKLARFVLVGATTIQGELEGPMIDRFGLICRLDYYSTDELARIITAAAEQRRIKIDDDAVVALAERSKGTPRIALRLLNLAHSYVVGSNRSSDVPVTMADVDAALELHQIDALGLDEDDRAVLRALSSTTSGMSLASIAATAGLEKATVAAIEPLLIRLGLMVLTARGRKATDAGRAHVRGA